MRYDMSKLSPISRLWAAGIDFLGNPLPGKPAAIWKIRRQPFFR